MIDAILKDALSLPLEDRGRLIQKLIESLDSGEDDHTAEDQWAELVARRIADLDAGRATLVDAEQALADAREDLRRRRGG